MRLATYIDLKKAGPVSASALVKLDNEGLRCLAMLSSPEQQLSNVSQLLRGELLESVQWLLKDTVYNDWLSGRGRQPESQLLWIHGRRGQGKSTLAAFVTQSLQQEPHVPAQRPAIFVAYYFHEQKVSRWPEIAEVLRTLIHRLILQLPDLIRHLLDVSREPDVGNGLFSNPDKLWEVMQAIIRDPRVQVAYFIVDTSGNCDEMLMDLRRNLVSSPVSSKAKWLLFSRDSPVAETEFSTAFKIDLNDKCFDYVNKRDGLATGPNKLSEGLQHSVYEPALLKMLQTAEGDIKEALKSILAVMAVACGPVSYPVLEILSDSVKKVASDRGMLELEQRLTKIWGSVIEVRDNKIYPVNDSLKTFLASDDASKRLGYGSLQVQHRKVSERCLDYIAEAVASNKFDLLEYPVRYCMEHGRQSSQTEGDLIDLIKKHELFFTTDSASLRRCFALYWRLKHGPGEIQPENFTILHIAAESGYDQLVGALLAPRAAARLGRPTLHRGAIDRFLQRKKSPAFTIPVDATDSLGRTPLHLAARHGDCKVAGRLIEAGANVLAQTESDRLSILEVAVKSRHRAMVQLLLSHGAEFDPDKLLPVAPTDIKQVLIEQIQLTRKPRPDSNDVDNKFWGTITDVPPDSRDYRMKPVTVDQILADDVKLDEFMLGDWSIKPERNRSVWWIHLPENNVGRGSIQSLPCS
jgi:hypothetical protein